MSARRRGGVAALAAGLLLFGVAASTDRPGAEPQPAGAVAVDRSSTDPLTAAVEAAQRRLATLPGDHVTWAELGSAYVEQARITGDPTYYDKADGALARSLALHPDGNDPALIGQGALANARHDFAAAARFAEQALSVNDYSATAWGVLTDARTQLGDYPGATEALQHMLALRPGIASFTRASYDAELHGDVAGARSALEQALEAAHSDSDTAYCRTYLGALAFATGDLDEAAAQYAAGLAADPGGPTLLLGQARVLAARGDSDAAVRAFSAAVDALPLPASLLEYGEYLVSLGRDADAQRQFALLDTVRRLFAASGVQDDLTTAQFAADHGDPATAVQAAQAEYGRRQDIDSQDALAWALHSAGRDAEALPLAQQATSLGGRNALFLYHRGAIEAALGQDDEARASIAQALDTNPYFSPLQAPEAEQLLASLGGSR